MLAKLIGPFKEFGFFAGLLYAIDRLFQRLSPDLRLYYYELVAQPIREGRLLPNNLQGALEIREIRQGDPEIALMPARPDIKDLRFKQNSICLGAFRKNILIGHIWFCFRQYEEDEVRCTFVLPEAVQCVFDFDLYLFPEHRMGLGFAGIWDGANEFLRRRGVRFSFSRLTRFNLPSRRAHVRLGARRVGRLLVLHAWGVELMVATVSPYVHLSFDGQDRAQVKLRLAGRFPELPQPTTDLASGSP